MKPTAEQIAYAAGLIEGEGSFGHTARKYIYPRFHVTMTDKEPLMQLKKIFGGLILGPYKRTQEKYKTNKPYWRWSANGWEKFEWITSLISPWLSPRRFLQIEKILKQKPKPRQETAECQKPPSWKSNYLHRKNHELPCKTCREWANRASRPSAKFRRGRNLTGK